MDYPSDHPLLQLPLTITQLENNSNELSRLRDQHVVDGREFSWLSSYSSDIQGVVNKINEIISLVFELISVMNFSESASTDTNRLLNHAFRVVRRLDAEIKQMNLSGESAQFYQLIDKISQVQNRIILSSSSSARDRTSSSTALLGSSAIEIHDDYERVTLPIYSNLPFQISSDQKGIISDVLARVCTNFPEIAFDHSHAQALIETLVINGANIEVQNHLYINFCPEMLTMLNSIGESIERCEPMDAAKKRQALTELLVFSTIQITFDGHQIFRICPDSLIQVLKEVQTNPALIEALLQPPLSVGVSMEATVFQKLLCVSHLNFSSERRVAVRNDPLVQAVLNSPNLKFFLIAGSILVNQCFKESCVGNSYNQFLQAKCGSVAELLHVAQEAVKILRSVLENPDLQSGLKEPAYKVLIGTAPTKKEHAEAIVKEVEERLSSIIRLVRSAMSKIQIDTDRIDNLTKATSHALQRLESVFDPIHPVITTTLPVVEYYNLSSVLSSVATTVGQVVPNQPTASSRGATSYSAEHLATIGQSLFSCRSLISIGEGEAQFNLRSAINNKLPIDSIWNLLFQHGGGIFRLTNESMEKLIDKLLDRPIGSGCGHAVALFSIYHQGEKAFLRKDPLGEEKIETLKDVKAFIEKYDYLFMLIQPISGSTA